MEFQHHLILSNAKSRGYRVTDLSNIVGKTAASIVHNEKAELFVEGTPFSAINVRSSLYFDNKQLTKHALQVLNIPFPKSILFHHFEDSGIQSFLQPNRTYVCKPLDMGEGTGVELNLKNIKDVQDYWERNHNISNTFMLEEQVNGTDIRIQVINGKIVAACTREPAYVIGDGKHTLKRLIEIRRTIIKKQNPSNDLQLDRVSEKLLQQQQITLNDIPKNGQKVILKKLANMSQGAIAIDITSELSPKYQGWIDLISQYLQVDYFAMDVILPNNNPAEAVVLEINAKPEWMHHTFSEGRQHDMAALVLDSIFE